MANEHALRIKNIPRRLREIGKIKIGGLGELKTSQGGKQFRQPKQYDHFVVTTSARGEDGNFTRDTKFHETIGDPAPKRLRILLPYNDPSLCFPTFYGLYTGRRCVCRGDGETAQQLMKDRETFQKVSCPCKFYTDPDTKPDCGLHGILNCMLHDAQSFGGFYVFRTGSYFSIQSILSSLEATYVKTGGRLVGIPFDLVVSPQTCSVKTGQVKSRTVQIVHIEYRGSDALLLEAVREAHRSYPVPAEQMERLEGWARQEYVNEGFGDSKEDAWMITQEFLPGNVDAEEEKPLEEATAPERETAIQQHEKERRPPKPESSTDLMFERYAKLSDEGKNVFDKINAAGLTPDEQQTALMAIEKGWLSAKKPAEAPAPPKFEKENKEMKIQLQGQEPSHFPPKRVNDMEPSPPGKPDVHTDPLPEPRFQGEVPFTPPEEEYNAGDAACETACETACEQAAQGVPYGASQTDGGPATDLGKEQTQREFLQEQAEKLDMLFEGKFSVGAPEEGEKEPPKLPTF